MSREDAFDAAVRRADMARTRFVGAVDTAKLRFAPERLKADARDKAEELAHAAGDKAKASVRNHPFIVGGAVTGVIAWLLRRPIAALSRWLYVKARNVRGNAVPTESLDMEEEP